MVIKEIKNIIKFIDTQDNKKIFIGGNGQAKITEITSKLF
jgi:UDP-N-acetylmuramoylalanine--D-glutamate ligase